MLTCPKSPLLFTLLITLFIAACGSESSLEPNQIISDGQKVDDSNNEPSLPTFILNGAGVKGPLAFADINIYAIDFSLSDIKGKLVASGVTNNQAQIQNLSLSGDLSGWYLIEFVVTDNTIDINTGISPIFNQLTTAVNADHIKGDIPIYATPLTTLVVKLTIDRADEVVLYGGNGNGLISVDEFESAILIAEAQVKSLFGFGISDDVNFFTTPPLMTPTTDSLRAQTEVAEYRLAIETFASLTHEISANSTIGTNTATIFDALALDITDGVIDAQDDNGAISVLDSLDEEIGTVISTLDMNSLFVPGTEVLLAEIELLLVDELMTTNVSVDTAALESGLVNVEASKILLESDLDNDGVADGQDIFPFDASETVDTDHDGIGDNSDAFPTDPFESVDSDLDHVGDNSDVFPFDPSESSDVDNDLVGDNADAFPNNPAENTDSDNDGVGDNADVFPDDPNRSELEELHLGFWIGSANSLITYFDEVTGVEHYRSTDPACDISQYKVCANGVRSILDSNVLSDDLSSLNQVGYHQFKTATRYGELDVTGPEHWERRQGFATATFKNRMWVIGGWDGIHDGLNNGDVSENDVNSGSLTGFDGYLANDVWSSQDGSSWTKVVNNAEFSVRQKHKVVAFKDKLWLIGGTTYNTSTTLNDALNDVWSSVDGKTWVRELESAPFSTRRDHALLAHDDRLWVIGGTAYNFEGLSDVWYSDNGTEWVQATDDAGFPGQSYPRVVSHDGKLMLIGGGGLYAGIWSSVDGVTWQQEANTNFPKRNVYSVTIHNNQVWVAGGYNGGYLRDVWVSDDGLTYREVERTAGNYFQSRAEPGFLSFKEQLWLLGGRGSTRYKEVLSSRDGATWLRNSFGPSKMPQRTGGELIHFNDRLFVFGGRTYEQDNDVWSSKEGIIWDKLITENIFSARYEAESVVFDNKLFVVGGQIKFDGVTPLHFGNDVWSSEDGGRWKQETANTAFSERSKHRIIEWKGQLWMTGGMGSANTQYNDVWSSSDGVNWTLVTPNADFPVRAGHSMFVMNNRLWVMGGRGDSVLAKREDVWSTANGVDWEETIVTTNTVFRPLDRGVRENYEAAVYNDRIYVIGGNDSGGDLNDIWSSSDGANWILEMENAGLLGRRGYSTEVYDGALWLHGGYRHESISYLQRDIWRTNDGVNWRTGLKTEVQLDVVQP